MSQLNDKLNDIAEQGWLKILARIAIPVLAFVGMSAWHDLKDTAEKVTQILINQGRYEQQMSDIKERVNDLEDWRKSVTYRGANQ